jgi:hypothetical protein
MIIYKNLVPITTLGTFAGALFTNASGKTAYVRTIEIHNAHTSTVTVKLYRVPHNAGAVGAAADANKFFEQELTPGQTVLYERQAPGMVVENENDTIQGLTDAGTVTLSMDGGLE